MKFLSELCSTFAPTGRVGKLIDKLTSRLEKSGFTVSSDQLGNVVALKGDGPYKAFLAHTDQSGWVIEHKDKDGYLHLKPLADSEKFGAGWAIDVDGYLYRVYESDKKWRAQSLTRGNGKMGDILVPRAEYEQSPREIYATALSDRFGIAALLQLSRVPAESMALIFYTARHLGYGGLNAAVKDVEIDKLYVIEAFPVDDGGWKCGEGAAVAVRTRRCIPPPRWLDVITSSGIPVKPGILSARTCAADYLSPEGFSSVVVGVPVEHYITRIEKMAVSDFKNLIKLLTKLAG